MVGRLIWTARASVWHVSRFVDSFKAGGFMNWLRSALFALTCVSLSAACSSSQSEGADQREPESVGETAQAITAACGFDTIGLPCDPDGPAQEKLECEGVCAISHTGLATCLGVVAGSLDGVVCGTTNGVGNAACKRYCSGRTCLNANAPDGAACRPTSKDSPCDGACDGSGACKNVAMPCEFGRVDQLCKFETCSFTNANSCVTKNLRSNTICSDADACSIGKCSGGNCVPGPTPGCDDGNDCTDDACDSVDGGCTGTPDDTNTCSDGDACTVGDSCSTGTCVPGTSALDCDDGDACTADSCDPNTGCAHIRKSCADGDACTDDVCDSSNGACSNPPKTCTDGNLCTTDSCNVATGCVFTAIDCDDADACTADSCSAGACQHDAVVCNDGEDCTEDSCSAETGCVYAPISGCGGGGAPGAGGVPGSGGEAAEGGQPSGTAGEPGAAGAGEEPGGGGAPAGQGGMPPVNGGSNTAGSAVTAGMGGANPTSGGNATTAGTNSSSGTDAGGEPGTGGSRTVVEGAGCGCRIDSQSSSPAPFSFVLAALGVALLRRRRAA
jgi:MYXO-CTERM domain-containing protein